MPISTHSFQTRIFQRSEAINSLLGNYQSIFELLFHEWIVVWPIERQNRVDGDWINPEFIITEMAVFVTLDGHRMQHCCGAINNNKYRMTRPCFVYTDHSQRVNWIFNQTGIPISSQYNFNTYLRNLWFNKIGILKAIHSIKIN